jgi:hypothetical protein
MRSRDQYSSVPPNKSQINKLFPVSSSVEQDAVNIEAGGSIPPLGAKYQGIVFNGLAHMLWEYEDKVRVLVS